jgi:hypothetical protein
VHHSGPLLALAQDPQNRDQQNYTYDHKYERRPFFR